MVSVPKGPTNAATRTAGSSPGEITLPPLAPLAPRPATRTAGSSPGEITLPPLAPLAPRPATRTAGSSPGELTSPSTGMVLVRIEPGEFMMGSPDSDKDAEDDEKPRHRVRITRSFYLGKYEVTQAEYEAMMGDNPSRFKEKPKNPVESVSWLDAVRFCNQLSEREGLKPRAYAPLFQGLRTTFSCVFEGFLRELSSNYIINTNCDALYSPITYRKVATK